MPFYFLQNEGVSRLFDNETARIVTTALLAAFGGLARLLSQKDKTPLRLSNVICGCLVATFFGVLAYFAAGNFSLAQSITYTIAGVSGWLGPQVIDIFINIVFQRTGLNLQTNSIDKSISNPENNTAPAGTETAGKPNQETRAEPPEL